MIMIYYGNSNYNLVFKYIFSLIDICEKANSYLTLSLANNTLIASYVNVGDYNNAISSYLKLKEFFKKSNSSSGIL